MPQHQIRKILKSFGAEFSQYAVTDCSLIGKLPDGRTLSLAFGVVAVEETSCELSPDKLSEYRIRGVVDTDGRLGQMAVLGAIPAAKSKRRKAKPKRRKARK